MLVTVHIDRYSHLCFHCRTTPVHDVNLASLRNCLRKEGMEDYCVSRVLNEFDVSVDLSLFTVFTTVFVQYWKWVRIHVLHQWSEPPSLWGQCDLLNRLVQENILRPAPWFDIASVFSTRAWITNTYSHFPLGTARSPLGFLTKTLTFERGYQQRTTERQKTGENGKWHHGNDTVRGNHGVGTFPDDRVRAMKECPH